MNAFDEAVRRQAMAQQQQDPFVGVGSAGLGLLGLQQGLQQFDRARNLDYNPFREIKSPIKIHNPVDVSLREELQQETDKALKDVLK